MKKKYAKELQYGDTVTIKKNLETSKRYGSKDFVYSMRPWLGKKMIIAGCSSSDAFRLEFSVHHWTRQMFKNPKKEGN